MKKRERVWLLFLLGTATIATILLAGGLSGLQLRPGQPFPFWFSLQTGSAPGGWLPVEGGLFESLWRILMSILLFVVLPIWIIIFIISPRARKEMLKKIPAYLLWALIIYGLTRAIQRLNPLWRGQSESALFPTSPVGAPAENILAPPAFVINPPQWLVIGLSLAVITLLLAGGWFIWQRTRRPESPLIRVVQEAQQALEQLQAGHDITDTIMRCYFEMSQVLSQQRGIHRPEAMTPREFEQHLARVGLQDEHIERLTRLFERIRYGADSAREEEEEEAVSCLTAIVRDYGRPS